MVAGLDVTEGTKLMMCEFSVLSVFSLFKVSNFEPNGLGSPVDSLTSVWLIHTLIMYMHFRNTNSSLVPSL